MQNKYWERPILLYLLTYQNRIEHFTKRYKYPSDIYSHFIKIHLDIQNKYIIFLHILLSPFRIFVVLFYFTFKFFKKVINNIVPASAKTNDIIAFCIVVAPGTKTIAITIPSFAESIVAPVVGETNLF